MAKRPGHNRGNLSIIPVKNNQMIENNPKFGYSEKIKMEKNENLTEMVQTDKRRPLFTLNACQDAKRLPKDNAHSPGFSKTPDIIKQGIQFTPQVDFGNTDKKDNLKN